MIHHGHGDNEVYIPETVEELFSAGNAHYFIKGETLNDNNEAMNLFIDEVGIPEEMIKLHDGTQIFVSDGKTMLQIDAGGLGDFHLHGYDVQTVDPTILNKLNESRKIRDLIREVVDEVIEEMTSTGAVAGYNTPAAFRGHESKKKSAERSMPGGKVVDDSSEADDTTIGEDNERLPMVRRGGEVMEEGRSRYRNFKESDLMKNHAKISYGIREAKKVLREVDFLVGICERLKTECDVPTDSLWKRTQPDLKVIHNQLKEIAKRINRIGR